MDCRLSLGLQNYDSVVGLRSPALSSTMPPWERPGDLLTAPELCAAMGEQANGGQSVFAWRVVWQYRELWGELAKRRTATFQQGNTKPWPIAHAARLFAGHAGAPPSVGPCG